MKRVVGSCSITDFSGFKKKLQAELAQNHIDTSVHNYELISAGHELLELVCSGDYLAYFSMLLRGDINWTSLFRNDYYGPEDVVDIIYENPSINDIKSYASAAWSADGINNTVYRLQNADTGKILYSYYGDDRDLM